MPEVLVRPRGRWPGLLALGLLLLAGLAACSGPVSPQAMLQALAAISTASPTPARPAPRPTATPSPTVTPTPAACDQAAAGLPVDVTIPDDTVLEPGEPFTKVWRVRNVGSCTWNRDYALVWVSGPRLTEATRVPLAYEVPPQATVDIEVPMLAPRAGGMYHSNWMLTNPQGHRFGLGPLGDQPLWVRVWVPDPTVTPVQTAPTPTPSPPPPTPTPTPTALPTEPPQVHETRAILPDTAIDLDALAPDGVADLAYRRPVDAPARLEPLNGARLGVFGPQAPGRDDCQRTPQADAVLSLEDLPPGHYVCYTTDAGRLGWLRSIALEPESGEWTVEIFTWPAGGEAAP